jgi:hypothetical protein
MTGSAAHRLGYCVGSAAHCEHLVRRMTDALGKIGRIEDRLLGGIVGSMPVITMVPGRTASRSSSSGHRMVTSMRGSPGRSSSAHAEPEVARGDPRFEIVVKKVGRRRLGRARIAHNLAADRGDFELDEALPRVATTSEMAASKLGESAIHYQFGPKHVA